MKSLTIAVILVSLGVGVQVPARAQASAVAAQPAAVPLNRILGTAPIAIPAGFSDRAALDCVEAAVHAANPKNKQGGFSLLGQWSLEERDPWNRWIRVAIRIRTHYAAVCYRIENGNLVPDVPVSRNLNQNGSEIHRNVPRWINNFGAIIKQQMLHPPASASAPAPAVIVPPAAPAPAPVAVAPAPAAVQTPSAPSAPGRFCESCGRKAGPDAKFCGGCGKKL